MSASFDEKTSPEPVNNSSTTPKATVHEGVPPPGENPEIIIPKRKLPKTLVVVILFVIGLGTLAFLFLKNQPQVAQPQATPFKHTFEEYPDFSGIPINENTISFVKADGKFCLLYGGVVYLPQDSGVFVPKSETATEEMLAFPWIGLVDAPAELSVGVDEVFSFKDSPGNNSFVFIMRWQSSAGERYHMYRFFNNKFSELKVFTSADGLYHVPKLNIFSLGGNFLNLSMFRCVGCLTEQPETTLYYIPTGDTRNIGKVSFFEWTEDDNVYRYKPYEEGISPEEVPLRTNEFFTESEELLNP